MVKTGWAHWVQNLLPPGKVGIDEWGHDHRHQQGYQTILFQICLRPQDIESQMSPSDHLCPWFYSFDPLLILRRRAPLFSAPWCQSQLFSGALNICIHLWRDPCGESGGVSLVKVPKTVIEGQQCCVEGQSWMVGFLRWLKPPSQVISFCPHPEPALGIEPSLVLLPSGLMTISGVQASAGAWPARPSLPVPFSSWAWIPPNQGLT